MDLPLRSGARAAGIRRTDQEASRRASGLEVPNKFALRVGLEWFDADLFGCMCTANIPKK